MCLNFRIFDRILFAIQTIMSRNMIGIKWKFILRINILIWEIWQVWNVNAGFFSHCGIGPPVSSWRSRTHPNGAAETHSPFLREVQIMRVLPASELGGYRRDR